MSNPEAWLFDLWIILNKMAISNLDQMHLGKTGLGLLFKL
jgi:hypothetical protein